MDAQIREVLERLQTEASLFAAHVEKLARELLEARAELERAKAVAWHAALDEVLRRGEPEDDSGGTSIFIEDLVSLRSRYPRPEVRKCTWRQDEDGGCWVTSCGHDFEIFEGGPSANKMRYCCHCGKEIEEVPYSDPDDGDETA